MVAPYQFVMIVGRFRDSTNDPRVSRQTSFRVKL
jgi:hypothetical protein